MRVFPTLTPAAWPFLGIIGGAAAGALVWLGFGVWASEPRAFTVLETQAPTLAPRISTAARAAVLSHPSFSGPLLFTSSTGTAAVAESELVLLGIAKGPRDQAALVSINKAAGSWLGLGQSRDGVTLVELGASKARFDTPLGFRDVGLDGASATGRDPHRHLLEPASAPAKVRS